MAGDWVKLHRQTLDSQVFSDPALWHLFCWCLLKTNWKTGWFQGVEVPAGSFATGREAAGQSLGMSGSAWYRNIKKLEAMGVIGVKANNRFTVISVLKWSFFQNTEQQVNNERTTDEQPSNNHRTTDEQRVDTIEEGKKERREERKKGRREEKGFCTEPEKPAAVPNFDPTACVFPVFPCSGAAKTWQATEAQLEAWRDAYPAINVEREHRKAHAWIMANLNNRKTRNGYPKFLNSWMSRSQDSAGKVTTEIKKAARVVF